MDAIKGFLLILISSLVIVGPAVLMAQGGEILFPIGASIAMAELALAFQLGRLHPPHYNERFSLARTVILWCNSSANTTLTSKEADAVADFLTYMRHDDVLDDDEQTLAAVARHKTRSGRIDQIHEGLLLSDES